MIFEAERTCKWHVEGPAKIEWMDLVYIKYFGDSLQSLLMDWMRRIRDREKSRMVLF